MLHIASFETFEADSVGAGSVKCGEPVGGLSGRFLIADASGPNVATKMSYAKQRGWYDVSAALHERFAPKEKAAVPGLGISDMTGALGDVSRDFAGVVNPLPMITRMTGYSRFPFNVALTQQNDGTPGHFVRPGQPIPVGAMSMTLERIEQRRVGAIRVASIELIRGADPNAPQILINEVARANAAAIDSIFLDAQQAETADSPSGIFYGATNYASAGSSLANIDSDLKKLLDALIAAKANLSTSYWLMHESTGAYLSLVRGSGGNVAFPGISARGGTLLGLPALTTSAETSGSPSEKILGLIDARSIAYADDGASELSVTTQASLQMDSAPSSNASNMVNTFQSNLVAFRGVRFLNFRRRVAGGAAYLRDVSY